jgi:hypothetical protein
MRLLHLPSAHRTVPVDEAETAVRRGVAAAAWAVLAELLFLAPLVVLVVVILVARALL